MNPFSWLNTQPWVRPTMGVLGGVAVLVKVVAHPNTVAYRVADWIEQTLIGAGAASLGQSNSGLKKA